MDAIDEEFDEQQLSSALAADALDMLGLRNQCLSHHISPLDLTTRAVGRAYTARAVSSTPGERAEPYKYLLEAIDTAPKGSIFVLGTSASDAAGVWGELVSTASKAKGLAGALTDGLVRDAQRVLELEFPLFSRGRTPYDSKGRVEVVAHGAPVFFNGVEITTGDLIVADADGVCVIPASSVDSVLSIVREKSARESDFRAAVAGSVSVTEAFERYAVL